MKDKQILKYIAGFASGSEIEKIERWIEEREENKSQFSKLKNLWVLSGLNEVPTGINVQEEVERIIQLQKQGDKKVSLFHLNGWIRVAAVAVIIILTGIGGFFIGDRIPMRENQEFAVITPIGERSQLVLPDGSKVLLNSGSKIFYSTDFNTSNREIKLEGEAWFDVEKNIKHPFIVHTSFYDVNVTGTEFNVKAYKDDKEIVTTLEEGEVEIVSTKTFNMVKDIILKPGEQIVYNKESREMHIKEVNTKLFTSWKDNKLIFINMNLKELIVLLERRYGVEIEVQDASILNLEYDGTFTNETILEVLDLLKLTLPIEYHVEDQLIIIKKK